MNSKEVLDTITNSITKNCNTRICIYCVNNKNCNDYKAIKQIEKDLDVLEIIQPMLKIKKSGTWEYLDTKHGLFDTKEELEKVKEWLEDDN